MNFLLSLPFWVFLLVTIGIICSRHPGDGLCTVSDGKPFDAATA